MLDKYRAAAITIGATVLLSFPLFGQQSYVTRFDVYGGYSFLDSPKVDLFENGVAFQVGFRPKTWLTVGFDYDAGAGDLKITPAQLLPALQTQLNTSIAGAIGAGLFPPPTSYNYAALYVPAHSTTQTFAFGPELVYRHFSRVTLFFRPVYAGAIHEAATPHPQDPVVTALVAGLIPTPTKTDSVPFIGFGGGFDILFGKHFAWRTQADMVYDHLFSDLLQNGRFTARFSCGPAFNFGKNIVKETK
ncbi:MAG: hypothetical protein ABSH56_05405 [Bryobacteraceae bacterium]|jgi:hypothetical protein